MKPNGKSGVMGACLGEGTEEGRYAANAESADVLEQVRRRELKRRIEKICLEISELIRVLDGHSLHEGDKTDENGIKRLELPQSDV